MRTLRHITLLLATLFWFGAIQAAKLDEQLALFLPGSGIQESSGRLYAQQQLEALFGRLEAQKVRTKKPARMLAMLQAEVEASFLQQPSLAADFHALIKRGEYNQNTATALYALVLTYFQIPYQLQVQAAHLVLLPRPDDNTVLLDIPGTDPLRGKAAQGFRQAYVDLLRATAYPPAAEQDSSTRFLYARYYFSEGTALSLKEAAAFMNYQQALLAYQQKAWSRCQELLARAQQLHAHPMFDVLERAIWLQLANQEASIRESTFYLWQLWEAQAGQPWLDELLRRFDYSVRQINRPTKWQIDSIYQAFQVGFGDHQQAQARLREHYFVLSAQQEADAGHTVQVLNLMDSLYILRPNNAEIQDILAGVMVRSLRKERRFAEGLKRIAYYEQHYPFLKTNPIFQDQHLFYRAEQVHHHFEQENELLGLRCLQEFEQLLEQSGSTPRLAAWVTTAYLAASNFYFRARSYPQARIYIEHALQHAPEDDYLLHRRDVLARY